MSEPLLLLVIVVFLFGVRLLARLIWPPHEGSGWEGIKRRPVPYLIAGTAAATMAILVDSTWLLVPGVVLILVAGYAWIRAMNIEE